MSVPSSSPSLSSPSAPAPYLHTMRVAYTHCTVGNHVYYARYFDFLEIARGEFFRSAGIPLDALSREDIIFPVIECSGRFKGAARYDDVLKIEVWITEMKGVRLTFSSRILREDGTVLFESETRHVCASVHEKPRRIPENVSQALARWLIPAQA